jgi:hypothetical protein
LSTHLRLALPNGLLPSGFPIKFMGHCDTKTGKAKNNIYKIWTELPTDWCNTQTISKLWYLYYLKLKYFHCYYSRLLKKERCGC